MQHRFFKIYGNSHLACDLSAELQSALREVQRQDNMVSEENPKVIKKINFLDF